MNRIAGGELAIVLANEILELIRNSGASQAEIFSSLDITRAVVPLLNVSLIPSGETSSLE